MLEVTNGKWKNINQTQTVFVVKDVNLRKTFFFI